MINSQYFDWGGSSDVHNVSMMIFRYYANEGIKTLTLDNHTQCVCLLFVLLIDKMRT